MKRDQLKSIKEAIKELKSNRSFVRSLELAKREKFALEIVKLDASNYFDAQLIDTLKNRFKSELNKLYDDFGMDTMIHIIYLDGSQFVVTGEEIVAGINPVMKHIAYACYSDGYTQYDTLTGCLDDMFQHGEKAEEMDNYFSDVEIKFGTDWGKRHDKERQS